MSSQEQINPQAAAAMDDIFGAQNRTESLEDISAEFENQSKEVQQPVEAPKKTGFQPKVAKHQEDTLKSADVEIPHEDKVTPERLRELEKNVSKILKGLNGVKAVAKPEKPAPIDFTKLSENDVYDLDIPIEAIDHGIPDYLNVELSDKNYIARWVHKAPRRLGPMMAIGWTYVEKQDLDSTSTLDVTLDANGHFAYDDVLLMKLPKQKYFGQLRRNHERALAQVNPKFHHQRAKKAVESALMNPENTGLNKVTGKMDRSGSGDFANYAGKNKLEVYVPGE